MKNKFLTIFAAILSIGAVSAQAIPLVFTASLSGATESPPNISPGTGFATVTIDELLHTMRVQTSFSGLLGTTIAAHIHCCAIPPGGNSLVATTVPTFPGFPTGVSAGIYDMLFDMYNPASYNPSFLSTLGGGSVVTAFSALLNGLNTGVAYLNIHTNVYAGGEIRGFLEAQQTAVSLPGTWLLLVVGLGGIAWQGRYRAYAADGC
jgi:hypothetical protein